MRDKDNATGLKEGGGIEIEKLQCSIRDARSLRFVLFRFCIYLPACFNISS